MVSVSVRYNTNTIPINSNMEGGKLNTHRVNPTQEPLYIVVLPFLILSTLQATTHRFNCSFYLFEPPAGYTTGQ